MTPEQRTMFLAEQLFNTLQATSEEIPEVTITEMWCSIAVLIHTMLKRANTPLQGFIDLLNVAPPEGIDDPPLQ